MGLVWWKLEDHRPKNLLETQSTSAKWKRIDFVGAFLLSLTILPVMLAVDLLGKKMAWNSHPIIGLFAVAVISGVLFCLTEEYWAREPIFPLRLISHYVVVTSYLQLFIQVSIQIAVRTFYNNMRTRSGTDLTRSSCFRYHYTFKQQRMRRLVKLEPISSRQSLVTLLVVLLLVLGSRGKSPHVHYY